MMLGASQRLLVRVSRTSGSSGFCIRSHSVVSKAWKRTEVLDGFLLPGLRLKRRRALQFGSDARKSKSGNQSANGMSLSDKLGAAVFFLMSGVTFGLGTWQAQRYTWKVNLVAERTSKLEASEVDLPGYRSSTDLSEVNEWMYRRVRCEGVLDFEKSIILGPRAPPLGTEVLSKSAVSPSGYFLIVPLVQDNGEIALVNYGWISKDYLDKSSGKLKTEEIKKVAGKGGRVTISGVIAPDESPGQFTPDNNPEERNFFWLDKDEMRRICNASPGSWFVDRVEIVGEELKPGFPAPRPIESYMNFKVNPSTHIGYAATWYGLCLTGLGVTKFRFLK